jgi:hypothetical protein
MIYYVALAILGHCHCVWSTEALKAAPLAIWFGSGDWAVRVPYSFSAASIWRTKIPLGLSRNEPFCAEKTFILVDKLLWNQTTPTWLSTFNFLIVPDAFGSYGRTASGPLGTHSQLPTEVSTRLMGATSGNGMLCQVHP